MGGWNAVPVHAAAKEDLEKKGEEEKLVKFGREKDDGGL